MLWGRRGSKVRKGLIDQHWAWIQRSREPNQLVLELLDCRRMEGGRILMIQTFPEQLQKAALALCAEARDIELENVVAENHEYW